MNTPKWPSLRNVRYLFKAHTYLNQSRGTNFYSSSILRPANSSEIHLSLFSRCCCQHTPLEANKSFLPEITIPMPVILNSFARRLSPTTRLDILWLLLRDKSMPLPNLVLHHLTPYGSTCLSIGISRMTAHVGQQIVKGKHIPFGFKY